MPHVQDYVSGEILALINKAFSLFRWVKVPLLGSRFRKYGQKVLYSCRPVKLDPEGAVELIKQADKCALGQRVCNELHNGADHGESVFLDELAEALVACGKARFAQKDEAAQAIAQDRKGPIIVTRVSGKHMEICRSIPKNCVYWNSEKHGLKCIDRNSGLAGCSGPGS